VNHKDLISHVAHCRNIDKGITLMENNTPKQSNSTRESEINLLPKVTSPYTLPLSYWTISGPQHAPG